MNDIRMLSLPANELTVPVNGEQSFPIRHSEWKRLRSRVSSLQHPIPGLSAIAWGTTGIGAGSFFAWIGWQGTDAQFPTILSDRFVAVGPTLLITAIAAAVVVVVFFVADSRFRAHNRREAADVLDEMDEIYKPFEGMNISIISGVDAPDANGPSANSEAASSEAFPAPPIVETETSGDLWEDNDDEIVRDNGNLRLHANDWIYHKDFGRGRVAVVSEQGPKSIAEVQFDEAGRKRLLVRIAPIKLISRAQ